MKKFKFLLCVVIISICVYTFYKVINDNLVDKKIDYQIQNATSNLPKNNIDTSTNLQDNNTLTNPNSTPNKSIENNLDAVSNDDFSVLVQSPQYNAIVSLDENLKEFKVSLLEEVSDSTKNNTSHYINFTEDNINYLIENKDTLIEEFKNCNIFDKYSMITNMIESYDTNINSSDLIELGFKYLSKQK